LDYANTASADYAPNARQSWMMCSLAKAATRMKSINWNNSRRATCSNPNESHLRTHATQYFMASSEHCFGLVQYRFLGLQAVFFILIGLFLLYAASANYFEGRKHK
jgi:hypothetical protein